MRRVTSSFSEQCIITEKNASLSHNDIPTHTIIVQKFILFCEQITLIS